MFMLPVMGGIGTEVREDSRGHEVAPDGCRLLGIPFGGRTGHREVADIASEGVCQGREQHQDAHIVHTASHMKDGRNAERAADLLQARAGFFEGFEGLETGAGEGHRDAPGVHHQDVVGNELRGQVHVAEILFDARIIAAHHPGRPPDLARLDGVDQGPGGPAKGRHHRFDTHAADDFLRLDRNVNPLAVAVGDNCQWPS